MTNRSNKEIEQRICVKIAEIKNIGVEDIPTDVSFEALGLDSLQAAMLMSDLEDWLDVKLESTLFYDYPSIQILSTYLSNEHIDHVDDALISSGENFDLDKLIPQSKAIHFKNRIHDFFQNLPEASIDARMYLMRKVISPMDREVTIMDPFTNKPKKMLMFGSNNYLGVANHPYVNAKVADVLKKYGAGIGGPPLLNGYLGLTKELEARLALLKHTEAAVVFPNGFGTNLGLVHALAGTGDAIFLDEYSHASFVDALHFTPAKTFLFAHNDVSQLERLLEKYKGKFHNVFIGVEGVYSMDGDIAPLDKIFPLCQEYNATILLDDAHGTGVMGEHGSGTLEHFNLQGKVELTMGTFSKAFASVGGFIAGSNEVVEYIRFHARSYMFSAALPPVVLATLLAVLDIIEKEPWRRQQLRDNVSYAAKKIRALGIPVDPQTGIIALIAPPHLNMSKARAIFHEQNIFVNSVEYPAVPKDKQRFRISLMANHTKKDIDHLVDAIALAWDVKIKTD